MSKPKEFWIWNSWLEPTTEDPIPTMCMYVFGTTIDELKNVNDEEKLHVIEKSAYDQALKERDEALALIGELEESLKHMANPLRCLDIVYKPWPQIMNELAEKALEKIAQFKSKKQ